MSEDLSKRPPYGALSGDPEFDVEMARVVLARVEHEPHSQDNEDTLFVELRLACGAVDVLTAQVAQLQAERDELRTVVGRLQDDILHKDETLALVERNRPVEAAFALAKVMRECREANGQIADLRDKLRVCEEQNDALGDANVLSVQLAACRAALVEACDLADRGWHSAGEALGFDCGDHPHQARIAALRSAAEGESE